MESSVRNSSSGGIGVTGILTIVFAIAKLMGAEVMATVPWWSFHPFQFSVFIFWTWALWVVAIVLSIGIITIAITTFID